MPTIGTGYNPPLDSASGWTCGPEASIDTADEAIVFALVNRPSAFAQGNAAPPVGALCLIVGNVTAINEDGYLQVLVGGNSPPGIGETGWFAHIVTIQSDAFPPRIVASGGSHATQARVEDFQVFDLTPA